MPTSVHGPSAAKICYISSHKVVVKAAFAHTCRYEVSISNLPRPNLPRLFRLSQDVLCTGDR